MARTPSTRPRRRHRTLVLAIAAGAAVMLVAAVAGWALHVRPADNPTRSALAATSPSAASPGPRTDHAPPKPPKADYTALAEHERQLGETLVAKQREQQYAPTPVNPPSTASTQTSTIDWNSLRPAGACVMPLSSMDLALAAAGYSGFGGFSGTGGVQGPPPAGTR
jgi:hypothetical protein